jgi:histone arginine demethylase JMJD6
MTFVYNVAELRTKTSWTERGYARKFDMAWQHLPDQLERINVHEVSPDEFRERWEEPYRPVVIQGCLDHWQARQKWTLQRLAKKYRNQKFKCGEDNDGYSVKLKMKCVLAWI